jgi:DNA-directed RNA polymerase sigma subunit (sigma70/sigma32)
VAASILIAQAIPDLLKEGDIANIKAIFIELNTSKASIMLGYQKSTKPYYDEIKKLLSKNIALLQLNDIISKGILEKELATLEPSEVDKILNKMRKAEKKTFEEEYMLQQEAKYRNQYIDPNKKLLEENMKLMMKNFTGRLSKVLESTNVAKK